MNKIRIGILFGGRSGEHEVSLVSAASVIDALNKSKYEIIQIGITKEGKWISSKNALAYLRDGIDEGNLRTFVLSADPGKKALCVFDSNDVSFEKLDVIFPVLHGTFGEDGTMQGLLELSEIPFVGAGVLGAAIGMDKVIQKKIFLSEGLPLVDFISFNKKEFQNDRVRISKRIDDEIKYPCFVKPVSLGSSVGISKVHSSSELMRAIEYAFEFDKRIIVEAAVPNVRELECAVLGNDEALASVVGEIISSNEFYDYAAKYVDGKTDTIIPAHISKDVADKIRDHAVKAFHSINCEGMARVDFLLERDTENIFLNEINTIPGFTSISMYPKLFEACGISYPDLLDKLIQLAIERQNEKYKLKKSYKPSKEWFRTS